MVSLAQRCNHECGQKTLCNDYLNGIIPTRAVFFFVVVVVVVLFFFFDLRRLDSLISGVFSHGF